ncbi:hypothetical protein D3C84_1172010 [compost metagenome]
MLRDLYTIADHAHDHVPTDRRKQQILAYGGGVAAADTLADASIAAGIESKRRGGKQQFGKLLTIRAGIAALHAPAQR